MSFLLWRSFQFNSPSTYVVSSSYVDRQQQRRSGVIWKDPFLRRPSHTEWICLHSHTIQPASHRIHFTNLRREVIAFQINECVPDDIHTRTRVEEDSTATMTTLALTGTCELKHLLLSSWIKGNREPCSSLRPKESLFSSQSFTLSPWIMMLF